MDNSPTALFDSYEHDFKQLVAGIKSKLDGQAGEQKGGEARLPWIIRVYPTTAIFPRRATQDDVEKG